MTAFHPSSRSIRRQKAGARAPRLRTRLAAASLAAALVAGCSRPAPPHPAGDTSLREQALLDSGNVAFRNGDWPLAAKRYASAAVVKPDEPAAFYGLGMALSRLGRLDEARIAYAKARSLAAAAADSARH